MMRQKINVQKPLITVVIPCKDRAKYLYHTLRTCMIQEYEPFEVIVSDDASSDNTIDVISDAMRRDSRIRFLKHETGVGMRENFEDALRQVKPGFVMALGSDDGLMPNGIAGMYDAIKETGLPLLAWETPTFSYPNVRGVDGQLKIPFMKKSKIINSNTFLRNQVEHLHYISDAESPMIYVKGLTSTDLVDRVKSRSANMRFYNCQTPDGYSGIVLAGEVECFAFSGTPFALHGVSPSSQGRAYLLNAPDAKNASEAFYRSIQDFPMHHDLALQPYSPLITLMTVDYLLRVADLPGWPGKIPPLDFKIVLKKALKELSHGLYGDDRIGRELRILKKIAEQHKLNDYFQSRLISTRRSLNRPPFNGSGINRNSYFLNAREFKLDNILDAAYAAKNLCMFSSVLNFLSVARIIGRSFWYGLYTTRKGKRFPPEAVWDEV